MKNTNDIDSREKNQIKINNDGIVTFISGDLELDNSLEGEHVRDAVNMSNSDVLGRVLTGYENTLADAKWSFFDQGDIVSINPEVENETNGTLSCEVIRKEAKEVRQEEPNVEKTFMADEEEVREIASSMRVESPSGERPADALVFDLVTSHQEVSDIKEGAFNIYVNLEQRIEEEKKRNPNSIEVRLLEEIQRLALKLGLRITKGDDEVLDNDIRGGN